MEHYPGFSDKSMHLFLIITIIRWLALFRRALRSDGDKDVCDGL